MNPYEVLGVPRNAHPEGIKRRWQKLSSQYHPDRETGDAAKMAEINRAYEILSDPDKRAHYEKTGSLEMPKPFELEVEQSALSAIAAAIESGSHDFLTAAINAVQNKLNELSAQKQNMRGKRSKLEQQKARISTEKEKNLFHMVIDQQLGNINEGLKQLDHADDVVSAVYELLQHYKAEPESMPNTFLFTWSPMGTSTNTTT